MRKLTQGLIIVILGVVLSGCTHVVNTKSISITSVGVVEKGKIISELVVESFDGERVDLVEVSKGKVMLLDFWAAWCPFCLEEMPVLSALQEEFGEKILIVGVHRTNTESVETGSEFAKKLGASYLLVKDVDGKLYGEVTKSVYAGMPVVVYVDPGGVVREMKVGPKTRDEMREIINGLLPV